MQSSKEQAQELERSSFLSQAQQLKDSGSLTPGKLADLDPSSRLNLVFDIDHTLIFALEKKAYPRLAEEHGSVWGKNLHTLSLQGGFEMWLVVRFGVPQALEYLSTFCTFYVYSHGLHHYISEILNLIDPDQKYFKNRDSTVLAPRDPTEQREFTQRMKRLSDYRDPNDRSKPMFDAQELDKTLIIDDQYAAIYDKDHLVMSKKFLKFAEEAPNVNSQKREHWRNYQYPSREGDAGWLVMQRDMSQAHWEVNEEGTPSQLYYICSLITRCYMARTLLSPERGIQQIMQEFKASIFKGFRFCFEDFLTVGTPAHTSMTEPEQQSAAQVRRACQSLVQELGGAVVTSKVTASHVVLLQTEASKDRLARYRGDQKIVNFKYITECYFQMMRLKLSNELQSEFSFEVKPK